MEHQNAIRDHWDSSSDEYYKRSYQENALELIEANPERAFPATVLAMIKEHLPDLKGKRVCVPSSGDNIAVFGFALMGAHVTSVDLSPKQVANAKRISEQKGWDIEFICDNSMELGKIESGSYDLVYTSNGVHVWIDDLGAMYRNFCRVLKPNGCYVFFETHPVCRPFAKDEPFKIIKPYEDVGPFGDVPTYGWRTQDFVNAIASSGFTLQRMEEFHSVPADLHQAFNYFYDTAQEDEQDDHRRYDWKQNPWAALPQCFGLRAVKR
jgi:SAM-dependent methyltransferase